MSQHHRAVHARVVRHREQIAGVLTFLRRCWGHGASPIEPDAVANIRDWTQARRDGWTVKELLEMK